jgi:hypothetical protein
MKTKEKIINELKTGGISIIDNYFDEKYCKKAINEINTALVEYKNKVQSNLKEGTSGDQRLFKIENASNSAKKFQEDRFINSILNAASNYKIESHFILGGKLMYNENETKNSGGGWHRDSDLEQFKAMVYLNDVEESNGPFLFLQNSDLFDLERRPYDQKLSILSRIYILLGKLKKNPPRYTDLAVQEYLKKTNTKPNEVVGKAGTLVLFNSTYLHRGKNIENGTRYTFTNYMFKSNHLSRYSRKKQFQEIFIK